MTERIPNYEIKRLIQDSLTFEQEEIVQFLIAYHVPAWPKSIKIKRFGMIQRMVVDKLECLKIVRCEDDEIDDYSKFIVNKCLFSCDVAEHAERIPFIGKMIKIGKFQLVLKAMRVATIEYAQHRNNDVPISQSQEYAKRAFWDDIKKSLMIL